MGLETDLTERYLLAVQFTEVALYLRIPDKQDREPDMVPWRCQHLRLDLDPTHMESMLINDGMLYPSNMMPVNDGSGPQEDVPTCY